MKYYYKYTKYNKKNRMIGGMRPYDLHTPEGRVWLKTIDGLNFLNTDEGYSWLSTDEGNMWLRTPFATSWLLYQGRDIWLQNSSEWLFSLNGYLWLHTLDEFEISLLRNIDNFSNYYHNHLYQYHNTFMTDDHTFEENIIDISRERARDIYFIDDDNFIIEDLIFDELFDLMYPDSQNVHHSNITWDDGEMDDDNIKNINIDNISQNDILNNILLQFKDVSLDNYISIKLNFMTGKTIDQGGVSRQIYENLLSHYFVTENITLINPKLLSRMVPELEERNFGTIKIPDISTHIPTKYYFNCEKNKCDIIKGLGYIIGYILHLINNGEIDFVFNFILEKYAKSLIESSPNISFWDNYCDNTIRELLEYHISIPCNIINYGTFPILSIITHMLTYYCGLDKEKIVSYIQKSVENIDIEHKDILIKILMKEIFDQCPNYESEIDEIDMTCGVQLNTILIFIVEIYQNLTKNIMRNIVDEIDQYIFANKINKSKYLIPLFGDNMIDKESLLRTMNKYIVGSGKDKLLSVISEFTYNEIRRLLYFWSGTSYLIMKPEKYKVEFLENHKYPTASTCSFSLYIPNNDDTTLINKLKISINETSFQLA